MSAAVIIIGGLLLSLVVLLLLNYYGDRRTCRWYVAVTLFIGWMVPFSIVFLLPLDLSSTLYYRCMSNSSLSLSTPTPSPIADPSSTTPPSGSFLSQSWEANFSEIDDNDTANSSQCEMPFTYIPRVVYFYAWNVMYWITFVFTWAVLPLMQSYVEAGEFTFWGKLRTSLRANLIFYAVSGLVGVLFLLYVRFAGGLNWTDIFSFCMMAANAWGMLLVVIFLGYGLVEVPRQLWYSADRQLSLRYHEFRAPKLKESLAFAEVDLFSMARTLSTISLRVRMNDPIRPFVDKLVHKCPYATDQSIVMSESEAKDIPDEITEKYLAKLHQRLKRIIRDRDRCDCQWKDLLKEAYHLQDIIKNEKNPSRRFESTVRTPPDSQFKDLRLSLEWIWYVYMEPICLRLLCVLMTLMTVALVWSEITFLSEKPVLSILAIVIHLPNLSYFTIELMTLVGVGYMCLCSYSSLFKVKVFNLYYLEPKHLTDESSLLFAAAYLCRLTFPLCYNFMNLIQEHNDTQFSHVLGDVHSIPILKTLDIYKFLPLSLVVLCTFTFFNVYGRILRLCNIKQFLYDDDDISESMTDEGRTLIEQARRSEERSLRTTTVVDSDSNESINRVQESTRRSRLRKHNAVPTKDGDEDIEVLIDHGAGERSSSNTAGVGKIFKPGFFWRSSGASGGSSSNSKTGNSMNHEKDSSGGRDHRKNNDDAASINSLLREDDDGDAIDYDDDYGISSKYLHGADSSNGSSSGAFNKTSNGNRMNYSTHNNSSSNNNNIKSGSSTMPSSSRVFGSSSRIANNDNKTATTSARRGSSDKTSTSPSRWSSSRNDDLFDNSDDDII